MLSLSRRCRFLVAVAFLSLRSSLSRRFARRCRYHFAHIPYRFDTLELAANTSSFAPRSARRCHFAHLYVIKRVHTHVYLPVQNIRLGRTAASHHTLLEGGKGGRDSIVGGKGGGVLEHSGRPPPPEGGCLGELSLFLACLDLSLALGWDGGLTHGKYEASTNCYAVV